MKAKWSGFVVTIAAVAVVPASALDIETVLVGNTGNTGELSGQTYGPDRICGAVDYEYRIGKYAVTAGQYSEFLNAVAGVDTYALYNTSMGSGLGCHIERFDGSGTGAEPYQYRVPSDWANRPVNYVSWADAARFANWLHNGQPTGAQDLTTTEDGAYFLNGVTDNANLLAVTREADWKWAIPSEDEWYKAAYHKNDGDSNNYFDYPTSSDTAPGYVNDSGNLSGTGDPFTEGGTDPGNYATYDGDYGTDGIGSPYWRTEVGEWENSDSPYGTFDQGGNGKEWNEAILYGASRGLRGGAVWDGHYDLLASKRGDGPPSIQSDGVGFRVSEVPEPATLSLLALGALALIRRGRKRRRAPLTRTYLQAHSGKFPEFSLYSRAPSANCISGGRGKGFVIAVSVVLVMGPAAMVSHGATPGFWGIGVNSKPWEISGDGSTVVGFAPNGNAGYWRTDTGWVDLGFYGYAYDASYDGNTIVGWTGGSSSNIAGNDAFRWTVTGALELLPGPANQAYEVSSDGSVVVGAHGVSNHDKMAFYNTSDGGTIDLSALLGLGAAHAGAVSGDGTVVGGSSAGPGFIWSVGDPSAQTVPMAVYALSQDGSVAAGFSGASKGSAITRWTADGGVVALPQLGDLTRTNYNYGYDITADGSIITGYHSQDSQRAVIWDADNGMRFLRDDLEAHLGIDLSDWQLKWAYVSDDGLTFTGAGINPNGQSEGWVAEIPEPATLSLLALGAFLLIRRRRLGRRALPLLVATAALAAGKCARNGKMNGMTDKSRFRSRKSARSKWGLGCARSAVRGFLVALGAGVLIVVVVPMPKAEAAGRLVAWGSNVYGERQVPTGNDFVAVSAGRNQGLALKSDGSLVAWGRNTWGERDVPAGNDFVAISAGGHHGIALKTDGSLVAWGRNDLGETDVPPGNDFVTISAGFDHSLALKADGSIVAWGWNYWGQTDVPNGNDFVAIAAGSTHNVALKADGSLVAWGRSHLGQLNAPPGNDFVGVGSGENAVHTLALRQDGSLVAWGWNADGQCDVPARSDFVAMAGGEKHSLVLLADGSLIAWGTNASGQCDVPAGNEFVAVAAGKNFSLALTPEPGTLSLVALGALALIRRRQRRRGRTKNCAGKSWLILMALAPTYVFSSLPAARGAEVYWDISHGVSDNYRPSGRYSVLVDYLATKGYTFTEGTGALDTADLSNYDILVIANGSCSSIAFTQEQISAIDGYVRAGGGMLVLSDISGSSGTSQIQQVANLFSATVGLSKFPPDDVYSTSLGSHPAVANVGEIYLRYSSTVDAGDLTAYAWYNTMPMLAAGTVGDGRVVLIADGDLFTKPPYYPSYFDKADNHLLAESTFTWLVPEPATFTLLVIGGFVLVRRRRALLLLLVATGLLAAGGGVPALAGQTYWVHDPNTPGNWSDANNWSASVPAGNSTTAIIDNGGIAVLNDASCYCGDVFVGDTFDGTLIQNNGALYVYSIFRSGSTGGGTGLYELHGGGLWTDTLHVGWSAPSEVIQTGGTVGGRHSSDVTLNVLSHGSYHLSGADSEIRAEYLQLQNRGGNGGRFIQDGGSVYAGTQLVVGYVSLSGNPSQYDLNAGQLTTVLTALKSTGDNLMRQVGGKHQTHRLIIEETARYEYGGGQLAVDADLQQDGTFLVSGIGQGIQIGSYQQSVTGSLISGEQRGQATFWRVLSALIGRVRLAAIGRLDHLVP